MNNVPQGTPGLARALPNFPTRFFVAGHAVKTSRKGTSKQMALSDYPQHIVHAGNWPATNVTWKDKIMMKEDLPIATFASPATLRDLCIGEKGTPPNLDHPLDVQVFHIRMANSAGRREAASLLIRKMYGWRGYTVEAGAHHEANKITLYAETAGEVGSPGTELEFAL